MAFSKPTPSSVHVLEVQLTRIMTKSDTVIREFSIADAATRNDYDVITGYITRLTAVKTSIDRIIKKHPYIQNAGLDEVIDSVDSNIKYMFNYRSKIS